MIKKYFSKSGATLFELLIALGILSFGILTAFGLLANSLGFVRLVSERYVANFLSVEGVEIMKNIIDENNWGSVGAGDFEVAYNDINLPLAPHSGSGRFLRLNSAGFYDYGSGGAETKFRRLIRVAYPDDCAVEPRCGDHVQVNSIVSWQSRGNVDFQVDLEDHFFNWRQ